MKFIDGLARNFMENALKIFGFLIEDFSPHIAYRKNGR